MTDKILFFVGDLPLALSADDFAAALAEGARILPSRRPPDLLIGAAVPSKLLTAAEVARELGVAVSQVRERVRRQEIPVVRVGRFHRFDLGAVRQALAQPAGSQLSAEKGPLDQRVTGDGFTQVSPFSPRGRHPMGARNGR